jgi:MarR family transcriptional regulator, transcriptional regulator for hemolysin
VIRLNSHEIFHTINQLSRLHTNQLNDVLKPFGLFSAQWSVIFVLKTKGKMTQKGLSQYLSVEAPPMTRTIQRLEKQGYVKKTQGNDKRENYIWLTDEALSQYPIWENAILDFNTTFLSALPIHSKEQLQSTLQLWLKKLS